MTYSIYQILNTANGMSYIGLTKRGKRRIIEHFHHLKKGTHHSQYLQNAYKKYGRRAFSWVILESQIETLDDAKQIEKIWVDFYDSYKNGYNMTEGGDVAPVECIPCEWNGVRYESITEAADSLGINNSSMWHRIQKGWNSDDDIKIPAHFMAISCEWNGIRYNTIAEAADANGVTAQTMGQRLSKGYSCDDDLLSASIVNSTACKWNGQEYVSIAEAALDNGFEPTSLGKHIRNGYVCDDDIQNPGDCLKKNCTWNGIEYESITQAAKANNVEVSSMSNRLKKGYTCDNDLNIDFVPCGYNSIECTWNDITYPSVSEAARALGIHRVTLEERLSKGYAYDDDVKVKNQPIKCIWNGIEYPSITAAAKANNISVSTMSIRIARGYASDDDLK